MKNGPSGQVCPYGRIALPAVAIAAGATTALVGTGWDVGDFTPAQTDPVIVGLSAALDAGLVIAYQRITAAGVAEVGVTNISAAPIVPVAKTLYVMALDISN
jgi:hypothetical protein